MNAKFAELLRKGDAVGIAGLCVDDAIVLPPDQGLVKGRKDIDTFWKGAMEVYSDGKLTTVSLRPIGRYFSLQKKKSRSEEPTGKYVAVWQKVGSEWKIEPDIWNVGK